MTAGRLAVLRQLGTRCRLSTPLFARLAATAVAALGARAARISLIEEEGGSLLGAAGPEQVGGGEAARLELPVVCTDGERVATFAVLDDRPREWSEAEVATLRELCGAATNALELCLENELLNALKESSREGVLAVTSDRTVLAYNRRFAEAWQIPDEVLATGSDEALLSAALSLVDDQAAYLRRVDELYAREDAGSDEILLRDGRVLSRYGLPLRGEDGASLGRIWHFRDITEPKRAEWALEEGEQRLRAFIESASDAAFTVDDASIINYVNPAVERIFGYRPSELIGQPLTRLLPEGVREGRPEAAPGQGGGGVRRIPWGAMEMTGVRKDGQEIPIEISFGRFTRGGRSYFTGLIRDITERKQVDRVIRDAAMSYRTLFDSLEEMVSIVDLDGHLLSVNEAVVQRHGYSREEILGGSPAVLTAPGSGDPGLPLARMRADPPPEPIRLEWLGRTKGGETFPMEVVLTRGEYFGAPVVIAVGRDVTERRRAEQALRASEEQFRQIAENIREDFWVYDAAFETAIYISPAHESVWGFSTEEAQREPRAFLARVLPEDLPGLLTAMERLGSHGEPVRIEYRIRRDDGSTRWVWSRGFPVFDDQGKVYRVVGTTEDVTERKEAEQAMRWMGTVVESSADAIISSVLTGEITSWNPAAERIFGYSAEEMIGKDWATLVPPDHLRAYRRVRKRLAAGTPAGPYEAKRLRKDGERIDVAITPFALHDHQGNVFGAAAIIRDITESKAREEQRRLLAAALEHLEEGVTLSSFEGRVIYANETHGRIMGYDPEARPYPSLRDFVPEGEDPALQKEILRTVIEEGSWAGRVRRRRLDDGTVIPLELITGRIDPGGDGQESLVFSMIRDITEEIERERYLRRAERLASVGTLVGGVAHELNNPLHAIRSFADLLLMDERSEEDREALEIVKRESDRAAKIVSDLRLFARQTQDEQSERAAVDLNDVVRHVAKVRRYALETRNVEIVEELDTDLPPVLANRGEVEQVVLNLVVNAEQAMSASRRERRLRLTTTTGAAGVVLRVADTGEGIAPEHRDRIFDPFFTTKSPGEGTGLGLSVVHSIVSEHGGRIRVESGAGGTTFVVELPVAGPADRPFVEEGERVPDSRGDLRVLVVEDEDAVRRATVRYLRRVGYHVDGAADGQEALRLLDAEGYDVIVSDLRMPGLDGESLLRELRRRRGGLDRRLIFVTGDASGVRGAPFLAGASVPILLKPVRLEEVARLVARLAGAAAGPSPNGG